MAEIVTPPAPNWLTKLEEQREKRLKVRLGHEAGAGSPCLTCGDKCPGLDLHFWRKICKICKCSKEDHDVSDDDIYGWAQFTLLGDKPAKPKKVFLTGRNDAVELEWTPKGKSDDVDKYLRELPESLLPVKGSEAAQLRKQRLQKQVPAHDIDPSLCHALTEDEIKELEEYVAYIRQHSVGQGHVIQLSLQKGLRHKIGIPNQHILNQRVPAQIASSQNVPLQGSNLANQLQNLSVSENGGGSAQPKHLPPQVPLPLVNATEEQKQALLNKLQDLKYPVNSHNILANSKNLAANLYEKYPSKGFSPNEEELDPQIPQMRDISYPLSKRNDLKNLPVHSANIDRVPSQPPQYAPNFAVPVESEQFPTSINMPRDIKYQTHENANYIPEHNLPHLHPQTGVNPSEYEQNPKVLSHTDIVYPELKTALYVDEPLPPLPYESDFANSNVIPTCHGCKKIFQDGDIAITAERTTNLWHPVCFQCYTCKQPLADLVYFYHEDTDQIYCGRDYAQLKGIPRCAACDELIFVREYCLAEDSTFHVKHFCCLECDEPLAGKQYVMEGSQPLCLPCFERVKAEHCNDCGQIIRPDQQGVALKGLHWHAVADCFACKWCRKPLFGAKMLLKNNQLFCSDTCFKNSQYMP